MKTFSSVSLQNVNDGVAGATGPQGPQGTSVAKVVREYTKSSSSSTLPSNPNWSETEPTIGANEYLWARDRTDLSDGTSTYGPAICSTNISGVKHDVDKANKSITDKVWESDITTKINQYDGSTVSTIRDRLSTTETDISGIKTRVSDVESETDDLGTRMTTAETTIDQTANNVLIKTTKSDTTAAQGGQHLIQSLINVAPSGVTISADKVDIEGATIFSSGRLSQTSLNNAYDAKGAAATAKSEAISSANSSTDTKLQSYSTTTQMNTAISNAVDDVEANANKTTVTVYYRSTTNSTPSISASTSIGTSNNADNAWSYVMPLPKKNAYFYICEEYTSVSGTKTFSTVRKLDSQTYASKWVSSNDNTLIDGGSIYAHSITSSQLATDAIKSNNYQAAASGPYSATGTFLDLSNGNFYTPNFGVQSLTGKAYLNGEIIATSGSIGDDSGNYWSIGNTIDSQGNGSASIVGNGTAYIQDGDWQIHSGLSNYSNGSINTQWYIQPQGQGLQLTYPYYDGYYYDYGMTSPVLDANSDRFYNQTVSQNFLYIRKHASTIPELESDWNYIFRIDKDGMIWINGQSLTQMIQSGVDGGAYLPTSGGTVNGNVTITGTLTATASKANQLTHTLSINGKGFDGSGDVNVGTIGAAYGGTGQTSLINSANALLNALGTGSSTPVDNDYYISQYVGGGTTTTTYHRRPMSALWSYIKGKLTADHSVLDSSYVLKSGDTITGSLTVENGIYSDSAQLGDLIVTGAGRFANGLYGDLIGNADTATKAAKVADSGNGTETTFAYSKSGLTTASWIAAWNGYELRAISPANLKSTLAITKSDVDLGNVDNTADSNKVVKGVSGIAGTTNTNRHVWFSDTSIETSRNYDDDFMYNPSTNVLTVGSITGNAATSTTATKFSSARTVALTGDVTGSASSDGTSGWSIVTTVGNDSHMHTPSTIIPGNASSTGTLDPITQSMIGSASSNKSIGLPANAITVEYSTNGGSTWVDYGATDTQKRALFNETRGFSAYLGKATAKASNNINNQLRITIEPLDRYVSFNALYIWFSTQGNTCTVDLERSTIGAKETFVSVFSGQPISGWSGNNIRYFNGGTFGGGTNQTTNNYKYRLTFKQTAINTDGPSAIVMDIRFLGVNVWNAGTAGTGVYNMLTTDRLYVWDADFNATFPAGVTATSFTGNASSASKLNSTRSFTIGNTAKNVDWSGAVSFSKAEISDDASSTANGWMSVADKKKLDSITVSDIGTIGANSIRGEKDIKVTISSGVATIGHENAAITAGTISGTATSTLTNGGSFKIPSITYDAYGHITGTAQTTITLPNITSVSGNAGTATKFSSARAISLSGDVSGSATADGSSGWSIGTLTSKLTPAADNRSVATTPNDYNGNSGNGKLIFQGLKANGYIDSPSTNTYSYLVGLRGWGDSSGGKAHELAFNDTGIFTRMGDTTTWEAWRPILDSSNFDDYALPLTGGTLTGDLIVGTTDSPANIQIGAKNDNYGLLPSVNNYNQIGKSGMSWYRAYISNYYGANSMVTNWRSGNNIGYPSTSSANAERGKVNFYNDCTAGSTQTKTLLEASASATSNITLTLPNKTGTIALTSDNVASATTATYSYYPKFVASNEIRFDINTKPSSATTLCVGYKWSDATTDAKINRYAFYNGASALAEVAASTFYGDLSGNATSATKAAQDGSGNVITSTYAKLESPTFTGVVTSPYYISTQNMTISAGKITELTTAPRSGLFANGVGITNPATRNDVGWIRMLGTGESDTVMEIATGDDGSEQIFVRQYNTSSAVVHELKLLDASGNTSVPNDLSIGGHVTLSYSSTTESLDFIFN